MLKMFKTRLGAFVAVVAVLAVAAGAYAYWTSAGTGTGSATAGTSAGITVNQTTVLTPMFPGDTAQTISGTFNNTNSGPAYVTTVTASISLVTKAAGAPAGTCDATDFTLSPTTATVAAEVPTGSAKGAWSGPAIKFNDKVTNQDACKGATVALAYTSN
jgi:hypothetical protein